MAVEIKHKNDDAQEVLEQFENSCEEIANLNSVIETLVTDLEKLWDKLELDSDSYGPDMQVHVFPVEVIKLLEAQTQSSKMITEKIASVRTKMEQNIPQKKTKTLTESRVATISGDFCAIMERFNLVRNSFKVTFERIISKQLKALGLPYNKTTLNKILETDITQTLLARKHEKNVVNLIEFFRHLKDCNIAVIGLETSLTSLYDEFSLTAEFLIKHQKLLEGHAPPLQENINFQIQTIKKMKQRKTPGESPEVLQLPRNQQKNDLLYWILVVCVVLFFVCVITMVFIALSGSVADSAIGKLTQSSAFGSFQEKIESELEKQFIALSKLKI